MARILITGAGGPAGLALARQLHDHELIGVDFADLTGTPAVDLFAELHRGPAAADLGFVPFLRSLVRTSRADLVIPTVQDELPFVAAAAELLGVPVVSSPCRGVALAHDKLLTALALEAAGVPVPVTLPVEELAADRFVPPFVVKPRVSRGGRGVQVIDDVQAAEALIAESPAGLIAQEFAPGEEYAVQLFRAPEGGRDEVIVLRKTALKQGRVGNAAGVERCAPGVDADIAEVSVRAVEALGLTGPIDVDVRRLADGRPLVLEINARFGANSEYAPELVERVLAHHLAGRSL